MSIEGIPRAGFIGSTRRGVRWIGVDVDVGVPSVQPLLSPFSGLRATAGGWMGIGGGMGKQ